MVHEPLQDGQTGGDGEAPAASETLTFKAKIHAAPGVVRRSLSDPGHFRRWWSGGGLCTLTDLTIDADRGGHYAITAEDEDGAHYTVSGEVLHASESLLAATFVTKYTRSLASVFYIKILPGGRRTTHVTVEHENIAAPREQQAAAHLWPRILAALSVGAARLDEKQIPPEVEAFLKRNPDCT